MTGRVLVVDDDAKIRSMIERNLAADGYRVTLAPTGEAALQMIRDNPPDLMVLDVNMPGMDGFEVCRRMRREQFTIPVILLTARSELSDRVDGLDAGADDYLPKPFAYEELAARLRALTRRMQDDAPDTLRFGDLLIDLQGRTAARGARDIDLTRTEFELLALLVRNARIVLERWKIIDEVWDDTIDIDSNTLEVYVGYLRKKLEADGEPRILHTVRGTGYVLREPADAR